MERAGIAHLKDRSVLSLSGGEWQRMIIARALCQQSDMILLDEPVSNLDIRHQVELLRTIRMFVNSSSLTAVAILHDLSLAYNYCDELVLLCEGGRIPFRQPEGCAHAGQHRSRVWHFRAFRFFWGTYLYHAQAVNYSAYISSL